MKAFSVHLCFTLVEFIKEGGLYYMGGTFILFFIQMEKTLHSPTLSWVVYALSRGYLCCISTKMGQKIQKINFDPILDPLKVVTNEKGEASGAVLTIRCWWGDVFLSF